MMHLLQEKDKPRKRKRQADVSNPAIGAGGVLPAKKSGQSTLDSLRVKKPKSQTASLLDMASTRLLSKGVSDEDIAMFPHEEETGGGNDIDSDSDATGSDVEEESAEALEKLRELQWPFDIHLFDTWDTHRLPKVRLNDDSSVAKLLNEEGIYDIELTPVEINGLVERIAKVDVIKDIKVPKLVIEDMTMLKEFTSQASAQASASTRVKLDALKEEAERFKDDLSNMVHLDHVLRQRSPFDFVQAALELQQSMSSRLLLRGHRLNQMKRKVIAETLIELMGVSKTVGTHIAQRLKTGTPVKVDKGLLTV